MPILFTVKGLCHVCLSDVFLGLFIDVLGVHEGGKSFNCAEEFSMYNI